MISPWMIYLIGIVDTVRHTCGFLDFAFLLCAFCFFVGTLVNSEQYDNSEKIYYSLCKLWMKRSFILWVLATSIFMFVPSSKTIAAMYVIPAIANNEKVQSIGKNGLELLDELTMQWLKELRGTKEHKQSTGKDI